MSRPAGKRKHGSPRRHNPDRTHSHGGYHHRNHHRHRHPRRFSPYRYDARWDLWDYAQPPFASVPTYVYAPPYTPHFPYYVPSLHGGMAPSNDRCMGHLESRQVFFLGENCTFPTGPICCPGHEPVVWCNGNLSGTGDSVGTVQCRLKED